MVALVCRNNKSTRYAAPLQSLKHQFQLYLQPRLLARLLTYPLQISSHCSSPLAWCQCFLLNGLPTVGTFTPWALPHFIANHCGSPVPITRDAAISTPLFTLVLILGYLPCAFPQEPLLVARLVTRLPLCSSILSYRPRGGTQRSSVTRLACGLRLFPGDRPTPKMRIFSGLRLRFRAFTLYLDALAYLLLKLLLSDNYTSERLTRPYSGELLVSA